MYKRQEQENIPVKVRKSVFTQCGTGSFGGNRKFSMGAFNVKMPKVARTLSRKPVSLIIRGFVSESRNAAAESAVSPSEKRFSAMPVEKRISITHARIQEGGNPTAAVKKILIKIFIRCRAR